MLNTTVTLTHVTPVPEGTSNEDAIALIHDAEHHIKCDPNMKDYTKRTPEIPPTVPQDIEPIAATECYSVTDSVPTLLPKGIWDRDAVSDYEFTFTKDGSFVRTSCPLSVVLETRWTVRDAEGGGSELVEVVDIKCSRFLSSVVKGQCDVNWKDFHKKILEGKK
ncbi:hypothetical protein CGCF415_v001472 [Colletotrichum fructicola]|uniref:DUF7053 domain-containing protein n=1 Tax=Colletotrichum fructicola (strain Nara gc5) TaxID=1213859 RepID=L2GEN2_COLFN|nr:uncharacterized protein CGMCC3_g5268 [Colletotrichum fructicola]KAF4492451.1 hypothetical protein CGGC5_v000494 [Colletotrichum fructicola Nara gc5]KAI8287624.1 hypothetical protein K4K60_012284 [Colletotrichum sp. SAR11_57]KAE9579037.1 hypothetical protein CGMCC3_g5268 [Colletotrichum fructicola]KAF4433068.1 hypothetical protein CFRS1_v007758 [Colletotrichum fructicola]KAF4904875.1 hypothetical protein CGCFRS4_v000928 [Colletotrichum fructicola]